MPPRLAMTVGMAVATTVDSIAARKTEAMTPREHQPAPGFPTSGHQCPPVQPAHLQSARSAGNGYTLSWSSDHVTRRPSAAS